MRSVFHILAESDWHAAQAAGSYAPESLAAEGFVHFSYRHQVARTANARYRERDGLIVVEFDPDRFPGPLVDEDLYGGSESSRTCTRRCRSRPPLPSTRYPGWTTVISVSERVANRSGPRLVPRPGLAEPVPHPGVVEEPRQLATVFGRPVDLLLVQCRIDDGSLAGIGLDPAAEHQ